MKRLFAAVAVCCAFSLVAAMAQDKATLMSKGEKVYNAYCKTCHQDKGQGMPGVYPPLAASDFIKTQGIKEVAKNVLAGKSGPMTVNGKQYNGVMTPIPANYSDEDVAGVVTYVMNTWDNPGGIMTAKEVKKLRDELKKKK